MTPATRPRPRTLPSSTTKLKTEHGNLYVTVSLDEDGEPFGSRNRPNAGRGIPLKAWMRQRGTTKASVEGRAVSLVQTRRFSVDYRKLNALLDPDTRVDIVTEAVSQYVRVS